MNHKHGGDIYRHENCMDFSANCNPLGTPEGIKKAVCQALEQVHHYPDVQCEVLTEKISAYEGVEASRIICGNGAADVIFFLCLAQKPAKALLPAPTFAEYQQALETVNCEISYYYLQEEQEFVLDEAFLEALTEDLDIVFICNPNNPTGILTETSVLHKILKKCKENGIFVVLDECFLDFIREPEEYTMKSVLCEYDNLFILKAFTKRYAIAGIRLGYGMTSNEALLQKMKEVTQPWNVSTLAQAAGIAALEETEYVEQGRALIFREQEYLKQELKRLGYACLDSQANYIFFKGREDLWERCLEHDILIRDCGNYPGLQNGYYRIAVRTHEENQTLIQVLEKLEIKMEE